ncbi:hypothetical protein GCM10009841_20180 [Microlunatus panaciterrae]|uniref:Uncharacterized protein n=1 Tax=Microlunatus panaciterrae TaxID=400768 RepID=A0ABS2RQ10_9ACTN|nr:hypothetical protein [Microlunatus panaciterrae]MBM7800572.1 hypothetical protein [Microlunatus panaciterrae]
MSEPVGEGAEQSLWQRIWPQTKWLRPSLLGLVLLSFFLPFVTVSCDTPGGFGRVDAGGTTSYSGFDLVFGGEPERSASQLLPPGKGTSDLIGVQPVAVVGLALLLAALVCSLVIRRPELRNVTVAALGVATVVALNISQLLVHLELSRMVAAQLAGRSVPPGARPGDYVRAGQGFALAMTGLGLVVLGEFIVLGLRMRREQELARRQTDTELGGPEAAGPAPGSETAGPAG